MSAHLARWAAGAVVAGAVLALGVGPAHAASVTVTSKTLTVGTAAPPALYPTSLTISGGNPGRPSQNDTVVTGYDTTLLQSTLCSAWSPNSASPAPITGVTVTIGDDNGATGDDTLTVTTAGGCSGGFKYGTVDLGSNGYVTGGNVTFTNSTITLTQTTTTTLTFTLRGRSGSGSPATVTSGNAAVYTPTATIADNASHTIGANVAVSAATVQF